MNPGIYPNIPDADYRKWPGLSQSRMKVLARSPMHAKYEADNPAEPTEALIFGQALHTYILEPGSVASKIAVSPVCDRRTTVGKATWSAFCAESAGKTIIAADDAAKIGMMSHAIHRHSMAATLLENADHREASVVWNDRETGTLCKARMDGHSKSLDCVFDIKTTQDASPEGFSKSILAFGYHIQAAHYLEGLARNHIATTDFIVIAVEKDPPYAVGVYRIDDESIGVGRDECVRLMKLWDECNASGKWPGYSEKIEPIGIPAWAMRRALETKG